jgi:hypothetical protein
VITLAANGEGSDYDSEQREVDRRGKKAAGDYKIVDPEEGEVCDRQRRGPSLRNHKTAALGQKISANSQGNRHEDD